MLKHGWPSTINGVNYRSMVEEFRFKVYIVILPYFLISKGLCCKAHGAEGAIPLGEIYCCSEGSYFSISNLYLGMLL